MRRNFTRKRDRPRARRGGRRRAARGRLSRRRRVRPPLRRGSPQPRRLGRGADRAPAERARGRPGARSAPPWRAAAERTTATTSSRRPATCSPAASRIRPRPRRDLERALGFLVRKGYDARARPRCAAQARRSDDRGLTRPPCNDSCMALWHRKPKQEAHADPLEPAPPFPDFPYHPDPREHRLDRRLDDPVRALRPRVRLRVRRPGVRGRRHGRRPVLPVVHRRRQRRAAPPGRVHRRPQRGRPGRRAGPRARRDRRAHARLQRPPAGALALPLRRRRRVHRAAPRSRGRRRIASAAAIAASAWRTPTRRSDACALRVTRSSTTIRRSDRPGPLGPIETAANQPFFERFPAASAMTATTQHPGRERPPSSPRTLRTHH